MTTENTKLSCLQSVKRQNGKRPDIKEIPTVVDLAIYVDRSGSVGSLSPNGWAEGFVSMIKEQKLLVSKDKNLKILVTLVTFDGYATKYYQEIDVTKIPDLNIQAVKNMFDPRGSTKLADTLYTGGVQQNARIIELEKKYGKENVTGVMVIWTDGDDNMSINVTEAMVHKLLSDIGKMPRRTILFTAANQDAIKVGARYGVCAANCLTTQAAPVGAAPMYRAASAATARACSGADGAFTQQERAANAPATSAPAMPFQRAPFQSPLPAPPPPPQRLGHPPRNLWPPFAGGGGGGGGGRGGSWGGPVGT